MAIDNRSIAQEGDEDIRLAKKLLLTAATAGAALFAAGVLTLSNDFNDAAPKAKALATYAVGVPTFPFTKGKLEAYRVPDQQEAAASTDVAKLATYVIGMPSAPFTRGKLEAYREGMSGSFNTYAPNTIDPDTAALLTYAIGAPTIPFTYKKQRQDCAAPTPPCKKQ